jgi:hypothetical protein
VVRKISMESLHLTIRVTKPLIFMIDVKNRCHLLNTVKQNGKLSVCINAFNFQNTMEQGLLPAFADEATEAQKS